MTMPKFEPVAHMQVSVEEGVDTYFPRLHKPEKYNKDWWRFDPLHSADQLTEAFEAGKRDAIPEWQPIETAPNDGTAFRAYADELIDLDFNPCGSVEAAWNGEEFIGCVWNGQQDTWYGKAINPTHWMPLPAAPKGEE